MEFVLANWELFAGVAVVAMLLVATGSMASISGVIPAPPAQVVQAINREKAVVLDLRDEESFAQGHLFGAKNVDVTRLDEQGLRGLGIGSDDPVILVTGPRDSTGPLVKLLKAYGVPTIYQLKGGIQSWKDDNLPLESTAAGS